MANDPFPPAPPPPPSGGPPSPLPPPPPPGPPGSPGYPGGYGGQPATPLRPPARGLRIAAVVLMFVTVAAVWLLGLVALARKGTWDDFVDGDASFSDVDDADSAVGGALGLTALAMVATAILLAIWSNRAASNGAARGASVSPGLAAGGWFIPLGNYVVPFIQLRRAMGARVRTTMVTVWQVLWIVGMLTLIGATQLFDDDDVTQSPTEVSDSLSSQSWGIIASAVILTATAAFAVKAMSDVDNATAG